MLHGFDILMGLITFVLLDRFLSWTTKGHDESSRKFFHQAFRFRMICAVLFSLITAYYYKGGDTEMFLYGLRDMREAIRSGSVSIMDILLTENSYQNETLAYYFDIDGSIYPVAGFMHHASNFMVPKLGLIPFLLTDSYIVLCFLFSFFALAGSIRLYKFFLIQFPDMRKEIAVAVLFLPSVCYWSSGFLKDSICFGAIGFLLYALYQLFINRRKMLASLLWIIASVYMIYTIKVYILLALIPGIAFWLFGVVSSRAKSKSVRRVIILISLILAGLATSYFINFLTSDDSLAKFSVDNLLESSENSREIFERRGDQGSNFQINTGNPILMVANGLVATFFRPFPWEVSSLIVLFSAIEAILFLVLIGFLIFKAGILRTMRTIFDSPILTLCFAFAGIFAVAVGISTTNFGSLSRYKIPCLPFYLFFIFGTYRTLNIGYPGWMNWILRKVTDNKIHP